MSWAFKYLSRAITSSNPTRYLAHFTNEETNEDQKGEIISPWWKENKENLEFQLVSYKILNKFMWIWTVGLVWITYLNSIIDC